MKSTKILVAIALTVFMAVFATTAVAAPLAADTGLGITLGNSNGFAACAAGSCFSMEVQPGFIIWTNFGPGTDGGIVVGKAQLSGGQEASPGAVGTDAELSAIWSFFSSNGTFYTSPGGDTQNIYDDAPCTGAACIGTTVLGVFNVAWNGNIIPMGSAAGCSLSSCSANQLAGIFVNDYQIDPTTGGAWSMNYSQVVPNGGFQNVKFQAIMRGTVTMPAVDPCLTLNCDDGNVCTDDSCVGGACVNTNNTAACNDNNACTTGDVCSSGVCAGTAMNCDDNNICTTDSCTAGACGHTNNNNTCNDNNACTTGDVCSGGVCAGTAMNCDDNNVCTTDSCTAGVCGHANNTASCNDNNACTTGDACSGGVCAGTAMTCTDNDLCTTDTCDTATGCIFTPVVCPTGACDPATGQCPGPCADAATRCNDNDACTTDTCDQATGACGHTAISCNDNSACTIDTCNPASGCVFTPVVCTDSLLCTTDTCNPATGCVFTPVACSTGQSCDPADGVCKQSACVPADCNDNNACTVDSCVNGVCMHAAITCNDISACTTDTCNPASGCIFTPIVCNDSDLCTTDSCDTATGCVFIPVICPTGACDPATGQCPGPCADAATRCNDNDACTTDTCDQATGACGHTAISCDDINICTTDSCDPATGCVNMPIPGCGVTGSDVGIVIFRAPSEVKDCRNIVPIQILTRNFSATMVTGTITLYKDGVPVQTWTDVTFNPNAVVAKLYFYNPAGDAGKTIEWEVVVDVPNDPNLLNNTSVKTTTVVPCGTTGHNKRNDGRQDG